MADLNSCSFTGRVTTDAVMKAAGTAELCEFSIANNTGFAQYAKTQFFKCQLWGKIGKGVQPYLTKGARVAVAGELTMNIYNDKQYWQLNCYSVVLLGGTQAPALQEEVTF